jgi:hypothetical protein
VCFHQHKPGVETDGQPLCVLSAAAAAVLLSATIVVLFSLHYTHTPSLSLHTTIVSHSKRADLFNARRSSSPPLSERRDTILASPHTSSGQ